jgi:hypothetical protein
LAEISEIIPPQINVEYRVIPTLSSQEQKVKSKVSYTDLTLKGLITRNNVFFQEIQRAVAQLQGDPTQALYSARNYIIACFGRASLLDSAPIRQILIQNAQPKNLKLGAMNANSDGSMPVDEITFVVDRNEAFINMKLELLHPTKKLKSVDVGRLKFTLLKLYRKQSVY